MGSQRYNVHCGREASEHVKNTGLTISMKTCPYCAAEIQDQAVRCKHCGEVLTAVAQPFASSRAVIYVLKVIGLSLAILGLVAALLEVSLVPISGDSSKARLVATRNQIDSFKAALGVYELDNGAFPSTEQGLPALITQPSGFPNWKGPYLDPPVARADLWGHAYIYKCPGVKAPNGYDLYSRGPNGVEGDDDDIGNWQQR